MKTKPLFEDVYSKLFIKQIREAQTFVYEELDKQIVIKLLEQVSERGLLPILVYKPSSVGALPINYSMKRGVNVNVHVPVPELELKSIEEYIKPSSVEEEQRQREEFMELLQLFKDNLKKHKESS